jgi:hypothetical protein
MKKRALSRKLAERSIDQYADEDENQNAEELKVHAARIKLPIPKSAPCRYRNEIWCNEQWAVTGYGIERRIRRMGSYAIAKSRLWEGESYGWVKHMSGKRWVNLAEFAEALRVARIIHAKPSPR